MGEYTYSTPEICLNYCYHCAENEEDKQHCSAEYYQNIDATCQDPSLQNRNQGNDLQFEILGLLGAGFACVVVASVLGLMVWLIKRKSSYVEYHEALAEFTEDGQFLIDDEEDAFEIE